MRSPPEGRDALPEQISGPGWTLTFLDQGCQIQSNDTDRDAHGTGVAAVAVAAVHHER